MITGLYVSSHLVHITRRAHIASVPWVWLLNVLILTMGGLVVGLLFGRGAKLELWGLPISVRGLYTPVLVLTMLVVLRIAILFRPTLESLTQSSWALKFAAIVGLACAGPLSPVLYGLGQRIADGRFVSPPILWRSSPRGVDLLAFVHPNPNHPLVRWWLGDGQRRRAGRVRRVHRRPQPRGAGGDRRRGLWASFRPRQGWWWLTFGFMSLALGPFVIVAGVNTHVPTPWALLRYVPLVSAVRTPTRFAIVAALGIAILLGGALAAIGTRWPHRRRALGWTMLLLVGFELFPAPRTLYSGEYSPLSDIIAADPRPVRVLNLPFGVRDGVSSAGNFSARSQFEQTRHHKALIGGYLSRVSSRRLNTMKRDYPTLAALLTLSEGHELNADEARHVRRERSRLRRAGRGRLRADRSGARHPAGDHAGDRGVRPRAGGDRPERHAVPAARLRLCANLSGCVAGRSSCCSRCPVRQPSSMKWSGPAC